jgi:serine/threonine protein kinase/Tfp pilus assembly protein PilF
MKCPTCQFENASDSKFCKECGTRIDASSAVQPSFTRTLEMPKDELTSGATFAGRYQIVEELGGGGMGKVYRALDKKLNEEVALKLIKPEIALDRHTLERFQNELKLARKISHRHVGRMYELMEEGGRHFITMEYVPGQDLRALTRQTGRLTVAKAVSIAIQVCEGLSEAHRLGVIHRDLKPSNIIIDRQGNARIMDFGIARSIHAKSVTGEGFIVGTPEYMSPEQVEGKEVDARSDIYSLGIVLYEMVTGQVPFEGDTPFTVGVKHKSEKPRDPKELNPQIPSDLAQLILRCLEKDPARRYQSADEVRLDLQKIEKALPTTERAAAKRKPSTSRQITVNFQPRKLVLPAIGIVAVLGLAFLAYRLIPRKPAAPVASGKPTLAVLYFENISNDKDLDAWKTGLTELLITKLGQSRFLRVLDGNTIYSLLRRLNLDEARKYTKEDLARVAGAGGANYTLSGSLMRAGQRIVISMSLQQAGTGDVIRPISLECKSEEEIMTGVDDVAREIKQDLNMSREQIMGDHDREAGRITTRSPEAFKYYSEARRLHLREEYQKSIDLMKKAVALDPEFAMAYRSMGSAYGNLKQPAEQRANYQKAFDYKDRVSDRERFTIEGDYYRLSEKTYGMAVDAYRSLLDLYPDDTIANTNLGVLYSGLEEWDKAIECYTAILRSGDPIVVGNLVECLQAKGDLGKAEEILQEHIRRHGQSPAIVARLAQVHCLKGQLDLALKEIDQSVTSDKGLTYTDYLPGKIQILALKDDLAGAEAVARQMIQGKNPVGVIMGWGHAATIAGFQGKIGKAVEDAKQGLALARKTGEPQAVIQFLIPLSYINMKTGSFKAAIQQLEEAARLAAESDNQAWVRGILRARGLAEVAAGSLEQAERTAAELKTLCEQAANRKELRNYLSLRGGIELARKNYAGAINSLAQVPPLAPMALPFGWDLDSMSMLAEAYAGTGDKSKALEQYEKIVSSPLGRLNNAFIYVISFYEAGKLCQDLGLRDKARDNFQKFLFFWRDADPGIRAIEDAKKRLAGL